MSDRPGSPAERTAARRSTADSPDGGQDAILARVAEAADPERRDVVVDFARVALRRVPAEQLRAADAGTISRQLVDAFEFADRAEPAEHAIRVITPPEAVDPRHPPTSIVQVHTADRPFLLATVTAEIEERDAGVVRTLHPVYGVQRDDDGRIAAVKPARTAERRESFVHVELDRVLSPDVAEALERDLHRDVTDVFAAADDFPRMRARIEEVAAGIPDEAGGFVDAEEVEEAAALLEWLLDGNAVLLGLREYDLVDLPADHPAGPGPAVTVRTGSGLGILAEERTSRFDGAVPLADLPDEQVRRLVSGPLLTISRTNRRSTVQRRARMDYIGLKRLDENGEVCGEFRILGLFTRKAYGEPARTTPVLRQKLRRILELEDVVPGSHDEATLISLFQALPKDELFQADIETLHELIVGLFHAEEHQQVRVAVRVEHFTRTVSVLLAVPQDRYSPELRRRFTDVLLERFNGESVDVDLSLGDRKDAVARFSVQVAEGAIPEVPVGDLQRVVRRLARAWIDDVADALTERHGQAVGTDLTRDVAERLPRAYRDAMPVSVAVEDIDQLATLVRTGGGLHVALQAPREDAVGLRLKAYRQGPPLELSSFLPLLEHLGLTVAEELPFSLEGPGPELHIHDFGVRTDAEVDVARDGPRLAVAILAAWNGQTESDTLDRLVLAAGIEWWQVAVLRAYRRYRRQLGTAYTPEYINDALAAHPQVVRALVRHFEARFDPEVDADERDLEVTRDTVAAACDEVARLDHDRILRSFLHLIDATLRTNVYRADAVSQGNDGASRPYYSFKLDSRRLPDAPKPVPHREIFVYSPEVEGVHLRGGPVARGGIRWSDRMDDVRTEVLGLMKAQMLKNAVIVPTGAKGGFVLKNPPDDPESLRTEVRRQYVTFVRGLLDVTDNLSGTEVVPPPQVVRYDGDDPYLVVAADKGTATYSDTANAVADDYGFWLGDAFASGGSRGYDHKALGITARGAWVAVSRHFRELGLDVRSEPVTVIGIGDMSGDVFGNGMLSSRTIRLVAAFDHRDIFLDPEPDPEASFEERQRLFELPTSSWQDYDRELISTGGGVFSRSQKQIELSPEVRERLRVDAAALSPPELVRAILRAPADLLWAGGIGTYVKASTETHDDIGDRANDELRIDATELNTRVVGEGANLALTQRARIQYARRGGRIDQDAIHNAAGVDISDHEVNVKILLRLATDDGRIDQDDRNGLLELVTDDVVAHVLHDVDLQTWALSQEVGASPQRMESYRHLMDLLEATSGLDRRVEALPDPAEMTDRTEQGAGLTRPELATLLGYAKRLLAADVLASDLPEDPVVAPVVESYFPDELVKRFGDLLPEHRLRRELVATLMANDVVNRMGITFVTRLAAETGASRHHVLAAYWASREVSGADDAWHRVDQLADLLDPERQLALKREVDRLVAELTRSYLDDEHEPRVATIVGHDRDTFERLRAEMMDIGSPAQRNRRLERAQRLIDDLVETDLAAFVVSTRDLALTPAVAAVTRDLGLGHERAPAIADALLALESALALDRLARLLERVDLQDRWARLQHAGLAADLRMMRADAVRLALYERAGIPERTAADQFLEARRGPLDRALAVVRDAEADDAPSLDAVAVAVRALREVLDRAD